MIKKLYVFAWLFLIGAVASSIFRGTLSELAMVAFAVIALGLIHAMAFWAALVTTKHAQPH